MQGVSIKPGAKKIKALILGICALCIIMVYVPVLCLPLALILPLLACPLAGRKQLPVLLTALVVPALASLMAGYDELYSISLSLLVALPLAAALWLPVKKQAGYSGVVWYVGAVTLALLCVAAAGTYALGGALWQTLPDRFLRMIEGNEQAGLLLYRFAEAGLIRLPEGVSKVSALVQAIEPAQVQEMLKSLKLTLESLLFDLLPMWFVQFSMIIGLFCALRVQKMKGMVLVIEASKDGEKKAHLAVPPGFSVLIIPPKLRGPVLMSAALALICMLMDNPVLLIIGQLSYSLFENVFMLAGAAVLVGVLSARHPGRKTLIGLLAGVLYIATPFLLFLIGLADQSFHFRVKRPSQQG